jgi:hypothetical protein
MAKKSKIAKNEQRKLVVARYAERRAELKEILRSPRSSDAERAGAEREDEGGQRAKQDGMPVDWVASDVEVVLPEHPQYEGEERAGGEHDATLVAARPPGRRGGAPECRQPLRISTIGVQREAGQKCHSSSSPL